MRNFVNLFTFALFLVLSNVAVSGDVGEGEKRYAVNCGNCQGPGGMGLASYHKISGKEVDYLSDRLKIFVNRNAL